VNPAQPGRPALYGLAAAAIAASLLLAWGFARVERQALRRANAGVAWLLG
jgi:hypothetical protein